MTITLPLPPNMANGRVHWRRKHKERRVYLVECDLLSRFHGAPRPPRVPPRRARVHARLHVWNPMDVDNAMARLKWAVDWLVLRKYLAGDSPRELEWAGLPDQVVDRKNPRLEIIIEEVGVDDDG